MNLATNWCRNLRGSSDRQGRWTNAFPSASRDLRAKAAGYRGRHDRSETSSFRLHRAFDATDAARVANDWALSVGRLLAIYRSWAFGVFPFLPSAPVSFRISDSCLDVRSRLPDASGRCIFVSSHDHARWAGDPGQSSLPVRWR